MYKSYQKKLIIIPILFIMFISVIFFIKDNSFAITKSIKENENEKLNNFDIDLYIGDYKRFNEIYIRDIEILRERILQAKVIRNKDISKNNLFKQIYEPISVDFEIRNLDNTLDSYYFYAMFLKEIEYNLNVLNSNQDFSKETIKYLDLLDEYLKDSIDKNKEIYLKNHKIHIENNQSEEKLNKDLYKKRNLMVYEEYKDYLVKQMNDKKYKEFFEQNKKYKENRIYKTKYKNYMDDWIKNYNQSKKIKNDEIKNKISQIKKTLKIFNIQDIDLKIYEDILVDQNIKYLSQNINIEYDMQLDKLNINIKDSNYKEIINILDKLKYERLIEDKNYENQNERIFNLEYIKNNKVYYDKDNSIYIKVKKNNESDDIDLSISINKMKLFLEDEDKKDINKENIESNKNKISSLSSKDALKNIYVFKELNQIKYRALYKVNNKDFAIEFLFKNDIIQNQYLEKYIEIKKISI